MQRNYEHLTSHGVFLWLLLENFVYLQQLINMHMEDISLIHKIIPGLPATEEEAIAQIEEIENSTDSDWLDFNMAMDEVRKHLEVYAY